MMSWVHFITCEKHCLVMANGRNKSFHGSKGSMCMKFVFNTLVENTPFCNYVFNYCSTINQVENYTYSCNLFFTTGKYFLQLLIINVKKYKSRIKLQSKVYATCQHHNNSHYVSLLTNLVENCSTNIIEGCC
jgi:hypothetical protein